MKMMFKIILFLLSFSMNVYSADDVTKNLIFHHAIMCGGKSTRIFEEVSEKKREDIFLITADITQKDKKYPVICARNIGSLVVDFSFDATTNFITLFNTFLKGRTKIYIDECQFLTATQVEVISEFCKDKPQVVIHFFGLLYDCFGEKFPSSESLETIADSVEALESKAICSCCGKPATHNVRIDGDSYLVETSGEQVGTTAQGYVYASVCREHSSGNLSEFKAQIDKSCAE